jgi:hypothetical protein
VKKEALFIVSRPTAAGMRCSPSFFYPSPASLYLTSLRVRIEAADTLGETEKALLSHPYIPYSNNTTEINMIFMLIQFILGRY